MPLGKIRTVIDLHPGGRAWTGSHHEVVNPVLREIPDRKAYSGVHAGTKGQETRYNLQLIVDNLKNFYERLPTSIF